MRKVSDDSPHRVVRELLERSTFPLAAESGTRAEHQVMRTVRELELMGFYQELEGDLEFVHLEYDKFRSTVRSRQS